MPTAYVKNVSVCRVQIIITKFSSVKLILSDTRHHGLTEYSENIFFQFSIHHTFLWKCKNRRLDTICIQQSVICGIIFFLEKIPLYVFLWILIVFPPIDNQTVIYMPAQCTNKVEGPWECKWFHFTVVESLSWFPIILEGMYASFDSILVRMFSQIFTWMKSITLNH